MNKDATLSARFTDMRGVTATVDWFVNQGIATDAITVLIVGPDGQRRPPQRGDNRRSDLSWIVSLDLARATITKREALDAFRREGGKR